MEVENHVIHKIHIIYESDRDRNLEVEKLLTECLSIILTTYMLPSSILDNSEKQFVNMMFEKNNDNYWIINITKQNAQVTCANPFSTYFCYPVNTKLLYAQDADH